MERIVVGVDGSEGSLTALAWAVEEARRGDASVEVVYTWHQAWVAPTHILGDVEFFAEKAEEVLDAVIAAVDTARPRR
jgi:nucleotide-binding universal stress UspA family protein